MLRFFPFFALLISPMSYGRANAGELYAISWNVENLFDTEDDPNVEGDEEFTPTGGKKHTIERYQSHLKKLAKVLMRTNEGKGPDILGLCEIENCRVLEDLVKELAPLKRRYEIIHQDSPSGHGIDTAILFDADRMKQSSHRFHAVPVPKKNTRDIVEAELTIDGKTLSVFMNHWPARANPEEHRVTAAKTLRARLDVLLAADKNADFLAMGDFNDYPTNDSIKLHLKALDDPAKLPAGALYDTMWPIYRAKKGTYVYKNQWEVIDHMIVSPGLLDAQNSRWRPDSTTPIAYDFQIFTPADPKLIPQPNRIFSGSFYHPTGVSDHLPIACVIEWWSRHLWLAAKPGGSSVRPAVCWAKQNQAPSVASQPG